MIKLKIEIEGINSLEQLKDSKWDKIIIFGETHGFFRDLEVQEALIRVLQPEIYLYEMMEEISLNTPQEFKAFLSRGDSDDFSIISTYGEIKPAIRMAESHNMKVIGCDIKNMGREDRSFISKRNLGEDEKVAETKLLRRREKSQLDAIRKHADGNSKVFVSLGAFHVLKNSLVMNGLKGKDFLVCYPVYEGHQEFLPEPNMQEKKLAYVLTTSGAYFK